MSRRRVTPEAQARAARIAAALSGLLEDEPPVPSAEPVFGDPYRPIPDAPVAAKERADFPCPCGGGLVLMYQRGVAIHRCSSCQGLWLDPGELEELVPEPESEADEVDLPALRARMQAIELPPREVVYRKCPRCRSPMNRRNFGDHSGVIVDECPQHGLFLDPGELEAIEAYISMGGLSLQRQRLARRNQRQAERERARQAEAHHRRTSPWRTDHTRGWWEILLWD